MSFPDLTLPEELELLHRQTGDIRRICKKQRLKLTEQLVRLKAMQCAITNVERSLQASRSELWENRFVLDLETRSDGAR